MAQTLEAIFHQGDQRRIDHTPSGVSLESGDIITMGGIAGVVTSPEGIADGELGAVDVDGMYKVKKASATTFAQGAEVEWDNSGKNAVAATSGTFEIGVAYQAAVSGDDYVLVWLNRRKLA